MRPGTEGIYPCLVLSREGIDGALGRVGLEEIAEGVVTGQEGGAVCFDQGGVFLDRVLVVVSPTALIGRRGERFWGRGVCAILVVASRVAYAGFVDASVGL
jgi:hypothetical protein